MRSYRRDIEIPTSSGRVYQRLRPALAEAGVCVDYHSGTTFIVNGFSMTAQGCDDVYCRLQPLPTGGTRLGMLLVGPAHGPAASRILDARRLLVARVFERVVRSPLEGAQPGLASSPPPPM